MNRKFYQKWNAFYSKVSLRYVIWGGIYTHSASRCGADGDFFL